MYKVLDPENTNPGILRPASYEMKQEKMLTYVV